MILADLVALTVDSLIYASYLFLVASGLTLIYGVMRILNMAHAGFYALGAYAAAWGVGEYVQTGGPEAVTYLILAVAAVLVGAAFGLAVEYGLLRFMYGRDEIVMLILTYGLLLVFEDLTKLIWGPQAYYAFQPYGLLGNVDLVGHFVIVYDLARIAVAGAVAALLWYGLNRTQPGKLLRVVIHDRETASAMGINVSLVFRITFVLGCVLAAFGGALVAPAIAVQQGIGIEVIVLAFAVVVTGGLGSIAGALVGALIVGFVRTFAIFYFPQAELFVIYGVMALVLAFRPQGLFALPAARKI